MNDKVDGENKETEIENLIYQIKQAIEDVNFDLEERNILVHQVDIELNSIMKEMPSGKFEFDWGPVKLGTGANVSSSQVSKIKLSISPEGSEIELMAPKVQKGLSSAIEKILTAVDYASSTSPSFKFENGTVELNFGVATDSEIKILGLGVSASDIETQKIVLHLKPSA